MHQIYRVFFVGLVSVGVAAGHLVAQADSATEERTTAHGVYSEAQATRGEELFWNICAECHVEDDFAGPFMQFWNGESVKSLFDEIYATMPEDDPGGLEHDQYIDVISYMFMLNSMPMGETDMSLEDLGAVNVDWRASYDDVSPVVENGTEEEAQTEDGGDDVEGSEVVDGGDDVEGSEVVDGGEDVEDGEVVDGGGEVEARTTAHGVYTVEQAGRGEDVFWNICSECHVEEDFAGPFMQSWSGAKIKDLFDEIQSTMPEDNPGGLSTARYMDVISYMFKINGMPTGDDELGEREMPLIEIDWRASYDDPSSLSAAERPRPDRPGH